MKYMIRVYNNNNLTEAIYTKKLDILKHMITEYITNGYDIDIKKVTDDGDFIFDDWEAKLDTVTTILRIFQFDVRYGMNKKGLWFIDKDKDFKIENVHNIIFEIDKFEKYTIRFRVTLNCNIRLVYYYDVE